MRHLQNWTQAFFAGLLAFCTVSYSGCGPRSPDFHSLLEEQPYVIELLPKNQSTLQEPVEIVVKFSHRMDIQKINDQSIGLVEGPLEKTLLEDPSELVEDLSEKKLHTLSIQYFLDDQEQTLTLSPETPLRPGNYFLIITPNLSSVEGIPFNQKPGTTPSPFIATFFFGDGISPDDFQGDTSSPPESFGSAPESLVINEVLYDGEISETDGEAFVELYGTPGADISLYQILWINGANGDETDRVTLPVGTLIPESGIFVIADLKTSSTSTSRVLNSNFLDQFDPQNGPDAVQLISREDHLLDTLTYGEGSVELSVDGLPLWESSPAVDVSGGHSLSRIDGVDTQTNAVDFVDLAVPTPGIL